MKSPQHFDRFTLVYLRAVLSEAKENKQILTRAQATLERWKLSRGVSLCHAERCTLLRSSTDVIEATVCVETEFAAHMRKNSPFAGVLPPQRRLALIRQSETP